jgi:branched-chain amino acid transport system permease protein
MRNKAVGHSGSQWGVWVIGLIIFLALPLWLPDTYLGLVNRIGVSIIVVLGLQILTGYCGLISLGHAGFMAVGAFSASLICMELGWSFWPALVCGALISGVVGVLFGLTTWKIGGFYLVVATLAAGIILPEVIDGGFLPWLGLSGFGVSMPSPTIGGITLDSTAEIFFLIVFFVLLAIFFTMNITRTRWGRIFKAIRDNEMVAKIEGVNIFSYKLVAFFISCVLVGIGGALWAISIHSVTTSQFPFMESIWYLGMLIVGGMGGGVGAVVCGAVVLRGVDYIVSMVLLPWLESMVYIGALPGTLIMHVVGINPLVISCIIMTFMIIAPKGVAEWGNKFQLFYRMWPISRSY